MTDRGLPVARDARAKSLRGTTRVWLLSGLIALVAAALWYSVRDWGALQDSPHLPWWGLAIGFYVAELAVVHLRFRKDAHSFSMSEIPLVVGLFLASPLHLVAGQLVGSAAVYVLNRRLPPLKLVFNLSQFGLQGALAVIVFRSIVRLGDPLGVMGWLAAVGGSLVATVVADLLINLAIRLTGGTVPSRDLIQILGLSALAGAMNTSLAVSGVVIMSAVPAAAWLALMPPIILFLAYRAYVSQRQERAKLESLYEATRSLHRSPQIEAALVAACRDAVRMLDAEFCEILLFAEGDPTHAYWTAVGPGERLQVMERVDLHPGSWDRLSDNGQAVLLGSADAAGLSLPPAERGQLGEAVVAPLTRGGSVVGTIVVFNRVGDISAFAREDVPLLDTLASQLSVSLENGRLEDSLAQLTELKDRLEQVIRSKDQFVASISHELRTPLTAVVGLSQELHDNWSAYEGVDALEMIDLIAGQSAELSHIIEDLLVAARADIGTLALQQRAFDLQAELMAVSVGNPTILDRSRPAIHIEEGVERGWGDPVRFRQIVRNLLTNADRYGGSDVAIRVRRQGQLIAIRVEDNGPGVPAGLEEAIFEPYRSAHEPGTQPGSVGLGLVVSRALARLMGGDLVYLRSNDLTTFELTLPAAPQPDTVAAQLS